LVTEQQLFTSLRDLGDEIFVQRAYLALLGRPADPTGYRENLAQLRGGASREQVWEMLACSAESLTFRVVPKAAEQAVASQTDQNRHAAHARELLSLHGSAFVRAAYVAILQREADPAGLSLYLEVLRSGKSRSYVIAELAVSTEARAKPHRLQGLDVLLRDYARAQFPSWRGWYWRAVRGAESDLPPSCETRMLAYAVMER
jgi:hypothetical protein